MDSRRETSGVLAHGWCCAAAFVAALVALRPAPADRRRTVPRSRTEHVHQKKREERHGGHRRSGDGAGRDGRRTPVTGAGTGGQPVARSSRPSCSRSPSS